MDGWSVLCRGLVCGLGALVFLRVFCGALGEIGHLLDVFERQCRHLAKRRADLETTKVEKAA